MYLFTARMSRLLGCSGASAGLGVSAGSGASAGWAGSGGLAAQVLGWGLGPLGVLVENNIEHSIVF